MPPEDKFPPTCLRAFDVIILSEGAHWAGNDGAVMLEQCLLKRGSSVSSAKELSQGWVTRLFKQQMERNAAYLQAHAQGRAVFFRTLAPGLPPVGLLQPHTPGGVPPIYTAPTSQNWLDDFVATGQSEFNHHLLPKFNSIARSIYAAHGPELGVMDVAGPMTQRVDGHLDPLHYCLPGPPDFYTDVLWNFMLGE